MAQVKKYAGGLRLIVENMPSLRSVSVGILVGAGSCLENADNNGISHFIEHTTFKGTKRFNSRTLSEAFDDIGSQVNAFTSKEMTCYYVKSTKSAMERSVDLLSDMFLNSVYDEDELNREKGVVIEEINMSEDTPEDVCLDTLSLAYFGNDGLGRTILGSKENITKFDKSYIEAYRKAYYNADNVVVSFAGNVTIEEADLLVSKYIEPFLSTNKSDSLIVPTDKNLYGKISKNKEIEQLHLALGFSCVKYDDELNNEATVMNVALGSGMSSRLFQTVREKLGLCYTVYSYPSGYRNTGSLAVYAGVNKETVNKAYDAIFAVLKELQNDGIGESELSRAKSQMLSSFEFGSENTASQMMLFGKYLLFTDKIFDFDNKVKKIEGVTGDGLNKFIRSLDFDDFSLSIVGKNAETIKF
ncbi:peptidase M16 domain protein [Acidiphilium sp. CAG:727]|nr:peptidase M16 domain protein [Acidiphilium sp. CAG:727]